MRGISRINHLLFADDCLIFIKAELPQLEELRTVMGTYESLAGQQINYSKFEICESRNLDEVILRTYRDYLSMTMVQQHSKYLGLPLVVGKNKTAVFRSTEDRMQSKVLNWKSLLLSIAGRETLIKAVLVVKKR